MARFYLPSSESTSSYEPLFLQVNVDGTAASSNDGESWTFISQETFNIPSIERVAVARDFIVFVSSIEGSGVIYYTPNLETEATLVEFAAPDEGGAFIWTDVANGNGHVVASGFYFFEDTSYPVFAYTDNGSDWTIGNIDPVYSDGFAAGSEFTSVEFNGFGWFLVNSGYGGFYFETLSQFIGEPEFVDLGGLRSVVWTGNEWVVTLSDDPILLISDIADPRSAEWSSYLIPEISEVNNFYDGNSQPETSFFEDAGGNGWFMIASSEGQILATDDGGTTWQGYIPLPYGGEIYEGNITSSETALIIDWNATSIGSNWDGSFDGINNFEVITIADAVPADYDGTYYATVVPEQGIALYTDTLLTTPLDTSTFDPFVSANFTLNRGTYFDSLGFGLNKFIAGNDDEKIFATSSDPISWDVVSDYDDVFAYWNDIDFQAEWGTPPKSYLINGDYRLTLNSSGAVKFPGAEILSVDNVPVSEGTPVTLDVNKQVQTLLPGDYILPNGAEGQIMYFVAQDAFDSSETSLAVYVTLDARFMSNDYTTVENTNTGWMLFTTQNASYYLGSGTAGTAATGIYTAIYTGGYWNISGGIID